MVFSKFAATFKLRFGDASSGKAFRLPYHTLSTILTARDASGRLSRLMTASSPGASMAPRGLTPPAF